MEGGRVNPSYLALWQRFLVKGKINTCFFVQVYIETPFKFLLLVGNSPRVTRQRRQLPSPCGSLQPGQLCCDSYKYNPVTHLCCNDNPAVKPASPTAIPGCCDQSAYDRNTHLCCDATLSPHPPATTLPACCGPVVYDSSVNSTQLCCAGAVLNKPVGVLRALCCGTATYNPATQVCCMGFPVPKAGGPNATSLCCGPFSYDISTQMCCNGNIAFKSATHTHCCGMFSFNPATHLCCNGYPYPKLGFISPSCCGSSVYDTLTMRCCDGSHVVLITPNQDPCANLA